MGGWRLVAVLGVAVMAVAGVGAVMAVRDREPLDAALAIVDDDGRFTTALDASDAFAEISGLLGEVECDAERDATCARVHRVQAWSQVTAVLVAQCTPPLVFEARSGLGQYLRGHGPLPDVPRCGARREGPDQTSS